MLIEQAYKFDRFEFPDDHGCILFAFPAYNDTFVLVMSNWKYQRFGYLKYDGYRERQAILMQVDSRGHPVIKCPIYYCQLQTIKMINDHTLFYLFSTSNQIVLFDLKTQNPKYIPKQISAKLQNKRIVGVEYFGRTNLITVIAFKWIGSMPHIYLIYFDSEGKVLEQFTKICSQQQLTSVWHKQFQKVNSHSKILWGGSYQFQKEQEILYLQTKSIYKKSTRLKIKLPNITSNDRFIRLANIWQTKNNQYLLLCKTVSKDWKNYKTTLYIYDDAQSQILRVLNMANLPSYWNMMNLDQFSIFNISSSSDFPALIFGNRAERVIDQIKWENEGSQELFVADYRRNSFVYTNQSQGAILLKLYRIDFQWKDKYMHLMLGLNENIDDDLLQEALTLLQEI